MLPREVRKLELLRGHFEWDESQETSREIPVATDTADGNYKRGQMGLG